MSKVRVTLRVEGARASGKTYVMSRLEKLLSKIEAVSEVKLLGQRFEGNAANGAEVCRYELELSL